MISKKIIRVAAAVLENEKNEILFSTRKMPDGNIMWEFPGGKIESGESAAIAAKRELAEELALEIYPADTMYITTYSYPDKTVELNFVRCFCFDYSTVKMLDNQQIKWCSANDMDIAQVLPADQDFLEFLRLRTIKS